MRAQDLPWGHAYPNIWCAHPAAPIKKVTASREYYRRAAPLYLYFKFSKATCTYPNGPWYHPFGEDKTSRPPPPLYAVAAATAAAV